LIPGGIAVGFSEKLRFPDIGVNAFRRSGFAEARVALSTSLIFGAVHIHNIVGGGPARARAGADRLHFGFSSTCV
jgi:hypothetical protein